MSLRCTDCVTSLERNESNGRRVSGLGALGSWPLTVLSLRVSGGPMAWQRGNPARDAVGALDRPQARLCREGWIHREAY